MTTITGQLEILDLEQRSADWFELRKTKRCASEAAMVMQVSDYGGWDELYRRKRGMEEPGRSDFLEKTAKRGQEFEETARQAYVFDHGRKMIPVVAIRGKYLASLDGYDGFVTLEIKVPMKGRKSKAWRLAEANKCSPDHYWQCQSHLMVMDNDEDHLWIYDPDGDEGRLVKIEPNLTAQQRLDEEWEKFEEYCAKRDQEAKDGPQAPSEPDTLAAQYEAAKKALDAAATHEKELKALLVAEAEATMEATGIKKVDMGVLTVTRYESKGSVKYKEIPELASVDLEQYRGSPTVGFRITMKE